MATSTLTSAGSSRAWSDREIQLLRARYDEATATGSVPELAVELGRRVGAVREKARRLGLADPHRKKRGRPMLYDWDRSTAERWLKLIEEEVRRGGTVGKFCRANTLHRDKVGRAIRRHFLDRWQAVVEKSCEKSRWYKLGTRLEHRVVAQFDALGFHTRRTHRSLTVADVTVTKLRGGIGYFVQAKRGGYVGPQEWNDLLDYAEKHGYTPLIASGADKGIGYYLPTGRKVPGQWRRQPMIRVCLTEAGVVPFAA